MKKALSLLGCALLGLASATAKADTIIVFNASGNSVALNHQSCHSNCAFSGTLTIDTTLGAVTAVDITFPGLSAFDAQPYGAPYSGGYSVDAANSLNPAVADALILNFTTTNPNSLIGFQGGTITGGTVFAVSTGDAVYLPQSGTISAPAAATPEPSSLMLLGSGILGLAGLARRRFR